MAFPLWPSAVNPNIVPYAYPTLEGMVDLLPLFSVDDFLGGSGLRQTGTAGDVAPITLVLGFDFNVPYTS